MRSKALEKLYKANTFTKVVLTSFDLIVRRKWLVTHSKELKFCKMEESNFLMFFLIDLNIHSEYCLERRQSEEVRSLVKLLESLYFSKSFHRTKGHVYPSNSQGRAGCNFVVQKMRMCDFLKSHTRKYSLGKILNFQLKMIFCTV